MSNRKSFHTN